MKAFLNGFLTRSGKSLLGALGARGTSPNHHVDHLPKLQRIPATSKFHLECRAKIAAAPAGTKNCPKCGHPVFATAKDLLATAKNSNKAWRAIMPRRPSGLLSLGVLVVIVAVCLMITTKIDEMISLVITFFGVWIIILAGIRTRTPLEELEKYERGAFSILAWGILLIAIGGAYFLNIRTGYWIYSLVIVLFVIGILVVAAALRSSR